MNARKQTFATIGILAAALGLALLPACGKQESEQNQNQQQVQENEAQKGSETSKEETEIEKQYRAEAEKGDAEAMFRLAREYGKTGNGDWIEWYRKAADKGHYEAMYQLARCYWLEKNEAEAAKMLRQRFKSLCKAAGDGDAEAMRTLGADYLGFAHTKQNEEEAAKWFREAADKGNALAMYDLGWCYKNGIGVDKNEEEAEKWFKSSGMTPPVQQESLSDSGTDREEFDLDSALEEMNLSFNRVPGEFGSFYEKIVKQAE